VTNPEFFKTPKVMTILIWPVSNFCSQDVEVMLFYTQGKFLYVVRSWDCSQIPGVCCIFKNTSQHHIYYFSFVTAVFTTGKHLHFYFTAVSF